MTEAAGQPHRWPDAIQALALLAIDPQGLGGVNLKSPCGPVRDRWLDLLRERLPTQTLRRVPTGVTAQRLVGGLDLAATLASARPIAERGLLSQADGGILVLAMAERTSVETASLLAAALDTGAVIVERDGIAATNAARFGIVALDEGLSSDEGVPAKLLDRMAFHLDLTPLGYRETDDEPSTLEAIVTARTCLSAVEVPDDVIEALAQTAFALGITSSRALLFAVKAARAAAALAGRSRADEADATLAAGLVLASRAVTMPAPPPRDEQTAEREPPSADDEPPPPHDQSPDPDTRDDEDDPGLDAAKPLADRLLNAVRASIPADLLDALTSGARAKSTTNRARGGIEAKSLRGGRPVGSQRGDPRRGQRLNVIETLRSAAPWQAIRRRERSLDSPRPLIEIRRSDFHVARTKQKNETAIIFVVDASGSSALNRMAEAKGAVELLLADCYVRRDHVAVIAFRGATAEILLPPTRSLVRAKRSLAGLPGGGATPIACALEAAARMILAVRAKGQTPMVIVLTDGQANVARDGTRGRAAGFEDALSTARGLRFLNATTLLIDTSPKSQPQAAQLAEAMAARYLALPYADSAKLSQAVRATLPVA